VANAWAVDLGTRYDTGWNTLRLTMAVRNFGPEIQLDGQYYDFNNGERLDEPTEYLPYHFPMMFKVGVAADPYLTETQRVTVAAEVEHPNDNLERLNVGAEYALMESYFLRGGWTLNHDTLGPAAGAGARWKGFGIDYAWGHYSILESVHRFSISFQF
jgi:hypothetical protein